MLSKGGDPRGQYCEAAKNAARNTERDATEDYGLDRDKIKKGRETGKGGGNEGCKVATAEEILIYMTGGRKVQICEGRLL